eukprot:COSAG05_NODE_1694_length_4265_cov_73.510312_7_plen_71_part_00
MHGYKWPINCTRTRNMGKDVIWSRVPRLAFPWVLLTVAAAGESDPAVGMVKHYNIIDKRCQPNDTCTHAD